MATHKPVKAAELFGELTLCTGEKSWFVVHTKPRCEKKLADYARRSGITYYLPQFTDKRVYQRRKVEFDKVLFPSYLFVAMEFMSKQILSISGYVVGYIKVTAQAQLIGELRAIYYGREKKAEMKPGLWLDKGLEVLITNGPLKGMQGIVEDHTKLSEVRLQVDILRQAVIVKVDPANLKIIGEYEVVEIE